MVPAIVRQKKNNNFAETKKKIKIKYEIINFKIPNFHLPVVFSNEKSVSSSSERSIVFMIINVNTYYIRTCHVSISMCIILFLFNDVINKKSPIKMSYYLIDSR